MHRKCLWISRTDCAGWWWIGQWLCFLMISWSTPRPRNSMRSTCKRFYIFWGGRGFMPSSPSANCGCIWYILLGKWSTIRVYWSNWPRLGLWCSRRFWGLRMRFGVSLDYQDIITGSFKISPGLLFLWPAWRREYHFPLGAWAAGDVWDFETEVMRGSNSNSMSHPQTRRRKRPGS